MDIKELKSKGLQKEFNIKISPKDISEKLNNKLMEISKTVSVDGFRKGKVPVDILKQKFGQEALGQILDETIKVSSNELIQKRNLKLAIKPKVEVKQFGEDKGLEYTIAIQLLPEIQIQNIKDIKLTKFVSDVDDEDLNKTLENIAKHQQTFEKKENKNAENGDGVLINMSASYNGQNIKEAELNNKLTVLGNNMMFPDIEKNILNTKAGEKLNFTTKFPKNFPNNEIADKDVEVKIEILEVRIPKQKTLDDNFAKSMGSNNITEFKNTVKEQMQKELENISKLNLKKEILDALDKKHKIELPLELVGFEFDAIWKKFLSDKEKGIIDETDKNKKEEELKKEYKSIAQRRVKLGLVLAKIGENEKISVSDEDLNKAIEEEILRNPDEKDKILDHYKNSQALAALKAPIFEEKVINHIISNMIKTVEKKVSKKELFKK